MNKQYDLQEASTNHTISTIEEYDEQKRKCYHNDKFYYIDQHLYQQVNDIRQSVSSIIQNPRKLSDQDNLSNLKQLDVKPKHKFSTQEEKIKFIQDYKKKQKTELCKSYEQYSYCKFGDSCSFAHGRDQLIQKQHLHENYKTKPCKKFFQNIYCSYGYRCQYLHLDILQHSQFNDYTSKTFTKKNLSSPYQTPRQIIDGLIDLYNKQGYNHQNLLKCNRLDFFLDITSQTNNQKIQSIYC